MPDLCADSNHTRDSSFTSFFYLNLTGRTVVLTRGQIMTTEKVRQTIPQCER